MCLVSHRRCWTCQYLVEYGPETQMHSLPCNAAKCNHLKRKRKKKEKEKKPGHEVLFQKHIMNKKEFNPFLPAGTSALACKHTSICFEELSDSQSKHQELKKNEPVTAQWPHPLSHTTRAKTPCGRHCRGDLHCLNLKDTAFHLRRGGNRDQWGEYSSEYPELKETCKDHQLQSLTLHWTFPKCWG